MAAREVAVKRYVVRLSAEERSRLEALRSKGKIPARRLTKALILLKADSGGRMAQIARKTKRYPSDPTDEEWEAIAPLMPRPGRRGRPREGWSSAR